MTATTIGVAAVKGPAGVSTMSIALAATAATASRAMMVEADPSGGSLLGWCDDLRAGPDLYEVALSRDSTRLADVAQRLGDVAVVPAWGRPFRLCQALARPRVPWEVLFGEFDGAVFVDVGRVWPEAPTIGLLSSMDVVVLVAPGEPAPVAAAVEWASRGGRHGAGESGVSRERLRLVINEVVGRRRQLMVSPRDLATWAGLPLIARFPHDERAVDWLRRGAPVTHRSLRHSPLIQAAATALANLAADSVPVEVLR
jgi:MinD-like ATPase involved in chromosome partitioning or flagellar assembly